MISDELEETIWDLVYELGTQTNCKDREVGCVIYNTKLQEVVGKGWNIHLDDKCDCDSAKTAQHAEVTAIHDMLGPFNRQDLILFVSHAPCTACASTVNSIVKEVRYRSQK